MWEHFGILPFAVPTQRARLGAYDCGGRRGKIGRVDAFSAHLNTPNSIFIKQTTAHNCHRAIHKKGGKVRETGHRWRLRKAPYRWLYCIKGRSLMANNWLSQFARWNGATNCKKMHNKLCLINSTIVKFEEERGWRDDTGTEYETE